MGYWVALKNRMGVRDWEGLFIEKSSAEAYAKKEGCELEHCTVTGDDKIDGRIWVASTYIQSEDLFEFYGLYSSYEKAEQALQSKFNEDQRLILGVAPV